MSSAAAPVGGSAEMSSPEIFRFFERVRVRELPAFRSLCNALKALVIEIAVLIWRRHKKGRVSLVDVGCGRGGDLHKWARFRLRSYAGVDGAALCIQEAKERHRLLVSQGKSNLEASFQVADLTREPLPITSSTMDLVSCMFFLQFAFSSEACARHVLGEVRRVLRPGGVLCALVPDGDRAIELLGDRRSQIPFGHFRLRKLPHTARTMESLQRGEAPFGVGYNFSLVEEACTEYVVSPVWLRERLEELGFVPEASDGRAFMEPAQDFFGRHSDRGTVCSLLKDQRCSQVDWLSVGFFSVLLARLEAS